MSPRTLDMNIDINKSFRAIIEFGEIFDIEESIKVDIHQILHWTDCSYNYQINKEHTCNLLNIYIFNSNATLEFHNFPELQIFQNNCVSLVEFNSIVIDVAFVYWYLKNHEERYLDILPKGSHSVYKSTNNNPNWKDSNERLIFFWVFGHELGHLFYKHNNSSFSQKDFQRLYSESNVHQIEIEADLFFVELVSKEQQFSIRLINFFINLLNKEIAFKIGIDTPPGVLIHFDYMGENAVEYSKYGSHPEFVIRIYKILFKLAELSGSKQHMSMLKSFSNTLKEL